MAAGRPVVAFAAGGALETVLDGSTGILFDAATPLGLATAIERFESTPFDPLVTREQALRFDVSVFHANWRALLDELGLGDLHT